MVKLKIKRILSILLSVFLLMSMTAASVSAWCGDEDCGCGFDEGCDFSDNGCGFDGGCDFFDNGFDNGCGFDGGCDFFDNGCGFDECGGFGFFGILSTIFGGLF